MRAFSILLVLLLVSQSNIPAAAKKRSPATIPDLSQLQNMIRRVAPTTLRAVTSRLSAGDRQAMTKIVEAARIFDEIFTKQLWSGDLALYAKLQKDTSPLGKARLHYFWINKGPWSDIDDYKAFLPGVPPRKLMVVSFYIAAMTKQVLERMVMSLTAPDMA